MYISEQCPFHASKENAMRPPRLMKARDMYHAFIGEYPMSASICVRQAHVRSTSSTKQAGDVSLGTLSRLIYNC